MSGKSSRMAYIDYAKAIGILLVILGHTNIVVPFSDYVRRYTIFFIYRFHMPLFLVIPGIVFGMKAIAGEDKVPSFPGFAKKLFVRLMVPYYVWSAVYILLEYFQKGYTKGVQKMILATLTTQGCAPLWFLPTLFLGELLFVLLTQRLKADVRVIIPVAVAVSIAASYIYNTWFTGLPALPGGILISLLRVFPALFFISFGCFVARFLDQKNKLMNFCAGFAMFAVLLASVFFYSPKVNMHLYVFRNIFHFLCTGIIGSMAVILLCMCIKENIGVLSRIGGSSLDIMALHFKPFPFLFISADVCVYLIGGKNVFLIWIITCAMVLPLVMILNLVRKWIRNITAKRSIKRSESI